MSGGHAKNKGHSIESSILNSIRYCIGYIERLIRNCISQIGFVSKKGKLLHNYIMSTQFPSTSDFLIKIGVGVVITILLIPLLIILLFWSVLKSI